MTKSATLTRIHRTITIALNMGTIGGTLANCHEGVETLTDGGGWSIDDWRRVDYARLDRQGHVYLDYTGCSLYAESQVRKHQELLQQGIWGNPHSHNPAAVMSTRLMESARNRVLSYFRADPEIYTVIFTANATGGLRLLGEAYPFQPGGRLLLSADNHNSVNGLREYARAAGTSYAYSPLRKTDLRLDARALSLLLFDADSNAPRLFAYPAQSNFSGVQHSLSWIEVAQERGWDVLVDCAAFAPTNRLDLSVVMPDFVPLSFYKMFGYPTGVGALIAKRDKLQKLRRPWFSGGTISVASVSADFHWLEGNETGFEDGTVNYLSLPAIELGLDHLDSVGIDAIHTRVQELMERFLTEVMTLRHGNGVPLVSVFGPETVRGRGGTVAFLLQDPSGRRFELSWVEKVAAECEISLRTGCFCNPGASEAAHGICSEDIQRVLRECQPASRGEFENALGSERGVGIGAVRISFGIASNHADLDRFLVFLRDEFLDCAVKPGLEERGRSVAESFVRELG